MWRVDINQHPTWGPWYQRVQRQPGWAMRAALTAAGLVIVIPLVLLILAAVVVGVIVFIVLALIASVLGAVNRLFQGGAAPASAGGRQNVRVVERD